MQVHIQNIVSTIRAVDSQSLLDQSTLKTILEAVMAALEEKKEQEERRSGDRQVTQGLYHESRSS